MPARLPDGTWISDDGAWRFVSQRWEPMPPSRPGRPDLLWFLSTRGWFLPALIAGAIALIPIAGLMNLYGWSLATAANLRAGYRVPAPADFRWMGRGARYVAWSLIVGSLFLLLTGGVGLVAGATAYLAHHDWLWTIGVGVVSAAAMAMVLAWLNAPVAVPVLDLIDREGFSPALKPARVVSVVRRGWHAGWYGAAAYLLWYVGFLVVTSIGGLVPFFGAFAGLALSAPAYGVLGLMLAAPLARVADPPDTFSHLQTWLVTALFGAGLVAMFTLVGAGTLLAANVITSHPEEITCTLTPDCEFSYAGDLETFVHLDQDSSDPSLVRVSTTFVNHGRRPAAVDPNDYRILSLADSSEHSSPSSDCPMPEATSVPAGGWIGQQVCFRTSGRGPFEVRVPWTGTVGKTVD